MEIIPWKSVFLDASGAVNRPSKWPSNADSGRHPLEEISSVWSILWSGFHICKSFKSYWMKSCYMPPTRPRSAPGETGPLWCAMPCGNISAGWNCEPVKSATARATRDIHKPTWRRGVGKRRPRGRKNSAEAKNCPRRCPALRVRAARQETACVGAYPRQCHRVLIHRNGCAGDFHDSWRAVRSGSD